MLRIKELRQNKGISMMEAARLLNMPYTTYVNYEKGLREPTSEVLILLANFYSTSVDYIVGRIALDVTPNRQDLPLPDIPKPSSNLSALEQDLIRKFRKLDDRGKSAVLNTLEYEYKSLTGEETTPHPRQA